MDHWLDVLADAGIPNVEVAAAIGITPGRLSQIKRRTSETLEPQTIERAWALYGAQLRKAGFRLAREQRIRLHIVRKNAA